MKSEKNAAALLKRYMKWPLWLSLFVIAATICVFFVNKKAGMVMMFFAIVIILFTLIVYLASKHSIMKALVSFAMSTNDNTNVLAQELNVPYALMDANGKINWRNKRFAEILSADKNTIQELFSDFTEDIISGIEKEAEFHNTFREKKFYTVVKKINLEGNEQYAIYLYDETAFVNLSNRYLNDTPVLGMIYIDNYDEVMDSVDDSKKSLILALIDRKISKFVADNDGFFAKTEKDKYLFIVKKMYLEQIEAGRFDILEDVKTVNTGNDIKTTLSIGIAVGSTAYSENYENARQAIDMALARGGDQVVIKEDNNIRYYGGKSQSIEKATRVKARVKAQAFEEIIEPKDKLIIMGHKLMDIDTLGAAAGIRRIAESKDKKAYIVKGECSDTIIPMLERFKGEDYPEDVFIDKAKAMDYADEGSALVIVDVNKPSLTEAPELLDIIDTVIVFDHHRQGTEIIEEATLSYIEPYASSASEMVAEIAQYISGSVRLKAEEADALYAGIVVDTHNFTNQTGVRTFEAAAFLRKSGADVTRVRKLFRDEEKEYKAKAEAIHNAEIYEGAYAITVCQSEGISSPTTIGAQAANELLDMVGIKASIVLTEYRDKIYISARSIDEVNVQVMMEKLGGGGHRSIAGAQLEGVSISEAIDTVKKLISDMIQKGELDR